MASGKHPLIFVKRTRTPAALEPAAEPRRVGGSCHGNRSRSARGEKGLDRIERDQPVDGRSSLARGKTIWRWDEQELKLVKVEGGVPPPH